MSFLSDERHVFVIRLWREPREVDAVEPLWRGAIEHIPSGDRGPVTEMADITSFIDEHIEVSRSHSPWQRAMREWFNRRLPGVAAGDDGETLGET